MLKKTLVVWLLFLTGCGLSPKPLPIATFTPLPLPQPSLSLTPPPLPTRTPIATHIVRDDDPATIQVFKTSENCQSVCWRGIHAGTTSAGQALTLLKNSKDIGELQVFDNYLIGTFGTINFLNGIVTSMDLTHDAAIQMTTDDFIRLMGEPDKLMSGSRDCFLYTGKARYGWCTKYRLYYSRLSAEVFVTLSSGVNVPGPAPDDMVVGLTVNIPIENKPPYLQPWLGYGRLAEYLINPMATDTPYP